MTLEAGAPFILDGFEYVVKELTPRFAPGTGERYLACHVDMPDLPIPPALPKDATSEQIQERKEAISLLIRHQRTLYPVRDIHCHAAEVQLGEPQDLLSLAREQAAALVRGKPSTADWAFKVALPFLEEKFGGRTEPFFYLPDRILPRHPEHTPITGPKVEG